MVVGNKVDSMPAMITRLTGMPINWLRKAWSRSSNPAPAAPARGDQQAYDRIHHRGRECDQYRVLHAYGGDTVLSSQEVV